MPSPPPPPDFDFEEPITGVVFASMLGRERSVEEVLKVCENQPDSREPMLGSGMRWGAGAECPG